LASTISVPLSLKVYTSAGTMMQDRDTKTKVMIKMVSA